MFAHLRHERIQSNIRAFDGEFEGGNGQCTCVDGGGVASLTTIPDDEWAQVENAAIKFWDEIASFCHQGAHSQP